MAWRFLRLAVGNRLVADIDDRGGVSRAIAEISSLVSGLRLIVVSMTAYVESKGLAHSDYRSVAYTITAVAGRKL